MYDAAVRASYTPTVGVHFVQVKNSESRVLLSAQPPSNNNATIFVYPSSKVIDKSHKQIMNCHATPALT